ncbi:MAG: hypothetical protein ABIW38_15245 [Ferruginibacter sp.]
MPGKIDKIYIACSKRDFYFAQLCISSIRYWEINIPIELIVDNAWGEIDITYLEKYWNVKRYNSTYNVFKESYGKLEPLFEKSGNRILTMDADIILLGNIVEELEKIESDFICQKIYNKENSKELNTWWFDIKKLKKWDTEYKYPGYVFYAGQLVTYDNILHREDFADVLEFGNPPILKKPDIFLNNADQGLLNYIIHKKVAQNKIEPTDYEFFIGRYDTVTLKLLNPDDVKCKKGLPKMLHFYGPKTGMLTNLPAKKTLAIYEKYYYRHYAHPHFEQNSVRFKRTIKNPFMYLKELGKEIYKSFLA